MRWFAGREGLKTPKMQNPETLYMMNVAENFHSISYPQISSLWIARV